MLELQAHGGPVVLQLLLARCLEARPNATLRRLRAGRAGRIHRRAFLNDKLDLAQAEAVADLIDASTEAAARSAARSLDGRVLARDRRARATQLIDLRMLVEATLDFPEEEIDFLEPPTRAASWPRRARSTRVLARARQGALLREGLTSCSPAQPNVGKSSLLNALAGAELAIVTPIAGTTRDKVAQTIQIEGVPVHVIDTAGLREATDEVERIGIARTWAEIDGADAVVFLHDLSRLGEPAYDAADAGDRGAVAGAAGRRRAPAPRLQQARPAAARRRSTTGVALSALHGRRASARLRERLLALAGWQAAGEGSFMARARHVDALQRARGHLEARGARRLRAMPRWSSSPRNCAWRTTRSARSPGGSRRTICWARSSGASASASDRAGQRGRQAVAT